MKWRSIQFDWNRARAFLVTAEEGSLSAAARALGMTQPTLGRQVAALEKELGTALFERGAQGLTLTSNGLDLLNYVKAMGEAANQLSMAASGQSESLNGNICITATEIMAVMILPPILTKLRILEPGITIDLIASNHTSDLLRREADIAIRAFRPNQVDLITKKIRDDNFKLYAANSYLERVGKPKNLPDLKHMDFIGFDHTSRFINILNEHELNLEMSNFTTVTESSLANWEMVKQGAGVGVMMDIIGDSEPLVTALPWPESFFQGETWLVSHRELRTSRRLKFVFDFLSSALQIP